MSETIRVQLARSADAAGILVEMTARGFEGELEPTEAGVSVVLAGRAGDTEPLGRRVWLALEDTISERRLPLVPLDAGDRSFVLRSALV